MTQAQIDEKRLARLGKLVLRDGAHAARERQYCAMEAVAWLAREKHSDHPQCACPVIGAFMRSWNDGLPDDETRTRILMPFVPRLVGSRSTPEVEEKRAYLALDWLIRVNTPEWMQLTASLASHAERLRKLGPIVDLESAQGARSTVIEARDAADAARAAAGAAAWAAVGAAAMAAVGAAAGDAAWAAVGAAARAAAGAAAWAAVGAAARAAVGAAAGDAAWAAVGAAAWAAAGAAAWDAAGAAARAAVGAAVRKVIAPTVEKLQLSAADLLERMLAVKP